MRIGIDLDDTTFVTINAMIKYADIYNTKVLGRKGMKGNLGLIQNRYYLKVLYGWDDTTKFDFFHKFYKDILEECVLMENANTVINQLREAGNSIYFITARLTGIQNCDTQRITEESLEKNKMKYDKLIINASDKLTVCKENKIDLFIEDSYETCKELEENGIKSILMTTKMNEKIDAGQIQRTSSWKEIAEIVSEI